MIHNLGLQLYFSHIFDKFIIDHGWEVRDRQARSFHLSLQICSTRLQKLGIRKRIFFDE